MITNSEYFKIFSELKYHWMRKWPNGRLFTPKVPPQVFLNKSSNYFFYLSNQTSIYTRESNKTTKNNAKIYSFLFYYFYAINN